MNTSQVRRIFKKGIVDSAVLEFFEEQVETDRYLGRSVPCQINIPVLVHKDGQSEFIDTTADKIAKLVKEEKVEIELSRYNLRRDRL